MRRKFNMHEFDLVWWPFKMKHASCGKVRKIRQFLDTSSLFKRDAHKKGMLNKRRKSNN